MDEKRIETLEKFKDFTLTFIGETRTGIKHIGEDIKDIKNNHLRTLNNKINFLLFVTLAGVFIAIIKVAFF